MLIAARCAACGGAPSDAASFPCADCGTALAECSACGWCVRLVEGEGPTDCDGCGWKPKDPAKDARLLAEYGPCPECGGPRADSERCCIMCSLRHMVEARDQIRAMAGPVYEKWLCRSQAGSAAWRAAGRPVKVALVGTPDGPRWYLHAALKRFEYVEATAEQIEAWSAYRRSQFELRASRLK